MKHKISKIIFIIAVLFVGIGLLLSPKYYIEQSVTIQAPPELVFDQINCLKQWEAWTPWKIQDKNLQISHNGPCMGVDCEMAWVSEQQLIGRGKQKIIASEPYQFVVLELDLTAHSEDKHTATMTWHIEKQLDHTTKVICMYDGVVSNNLFSKYMCFLKEQKMNYTIEQSLRRLKRHVEYFLEYPA